VFGIVTLTDLLITITVIQTAIIAFLMVFIIFKIKKSLNQPATDKIDNELSKKLSSLDTKVSLISNEFTQAIKENTENITKLSSTVDATSASTAAALAKANSSLSSLSDASSALLNPAMTSGLFERVTDNNYIQPQFLEIDEGNPKVKDSGADLIDKIKIDPAIVQNYNGLPNQKSLNKVIPSSSFSSFPSSSSFISTQTNEAKVFSPSSLNLGSRIGLKAHLGQPVVQDGLSEEKEEEKQGMFNSSIDKETKESADLPFVTSESSREINLSSPSFQNEHEAVKDISSNPQINDKNDKENQDSNSNGEIVDNNERNSNPEIDKLDIEILSALKRLGGMDETSANENETADTSASENKANN
jgi:hypothetical protein